ncbi:MAG TPA: SDR family oxidoreductase [Acidimicrobiales bacterium]|nr:SDR family oxidoreductase [Acidimicrobiales bacterium]
MDGKVAIVTGAGSTPGPGMATGRGTAIVMAREGARVLVADIRRDRAEETKSIIENEGGSAAVFVGDLTKATGCEAMAHAALDAFGTVDILVNNIAAAMPGNVVETSVEDFDHVLDVSLRTTFLSCKYTVPIMVAKGAGAIVNIGSIAAFRGGNYVGYAAAKGAVHALTVDMAYSHGRQGIRVNAIAPGHLTTPMLLANEGQTSQTDHRQRMANAAGLLGIEGNGWDVAMAATFLASDEARWITGVTLPVDSGIMSVTPLMMASHLRAIPGLDE